eukprot:scaffold25515_cov36-Tisochrysis_lutea.AAC.4
MELTRHLLDTQVKSTRKNVGVGTRRRMIDTMTNSEWAALSSTRHEGKRGGRGIQQCPVVAQDQVLVPLEPISTRREPNDVGRVEYHAWVERKHRPHPRHSIDEDAMPRIRAQASRARRRYAHAEAERVTLRVSHVGIVLLDNCLPQLA